MPGPGTHRCPLEDQHDRLNVGTTCGVCDYRRPTLLEREEQRQRELALLMSLDDLRGEIAARLVKESEPGSAFGLMEVRAHTDYRDFVQDDGQPVRDETLAAVRALKEEARQALHELYAPESVQGGGQPGVQDGGQDPVVIDIRPDFESLPKAKQLAETYRAARLARAPLETLVEIADDLMVEVLNG